MEIFIAEIKNSENICASREEPKDISEWDGVKFDSKLDDLTVID